MVRKGGKARLDGPRVDCAGPLRGEAGAVRLRARADRPACCEGARRELAAHNSFYSKADTKVTR